jgi:hypothetical protein
MQSMNQVARDLTSRRHEHIIPPSCLTRVTLCCVGEALGRLRCHSDCCILLHGPAPLFLELIRILVSTATLVRCPARLNALNQTDEAMGSCSSGFGAPEAVPSCRPVWLPGDQFPCHPNQEGGLDCRGRELNRWRSANGRSSIVLG